MYLSKWLKVQFYNDKKIGNIQTLFDKIVYDYQKKEEE